MAGLSAPADASTAPTPTAATATSSLSSALPVEGARASSARQIINKASEKVIERITLESIEQSFPDFLDIEKNAEDRAFGELLTNTIRDNLKLSFDEAWQHLFADSDFKGFTTRANAVDAEFAAATQRRDRRERPQDAWKKGADPLIAIAAAVTPKLQTNLATARQIKTELADEAESRTQRILAAQAEADSLQTDIESILNSIAEAEKNLDSIDSKAMQELMGNLIPLIESDKI